MHGGRGGLTVDLIAAVGWIPYADIVILPDCATGTNLWSSVSGSYIA